MDMQFGIGKGWAKRMKLDDHLLLWNQSSVKVMDIRHRSMEPGEELLGYRLPANVFLYATRGNAQVRIDGVAHEAQRFHVLHGGKGACLDIAAKPSFEYYMIMYKASASFPSRQEFMRTCSKIISWPSPLPMRPGVNLNAK